VLTLGNNSATGIIADVLPAALLANLRTILYCNFRRESILVYVSVYNTALRFVLTIILLHRMDNYYDNRWLLLLSYLTSWFIRNGNVDATAAVVPVVFIT
jgi:hypothetical protein